MVLIPNATTGTNTVLRNLRWEEGDAIIYFSTIYDALEKTVESVREMAGAEIGVHVIELRFPIGEEVVLERFRRTVVEGRQRGVRFKMAIFDTVSLFHLENEGSAFVSTYDSSTLFLTCVSMHHFIL